jgi:pyruvate dehydrogenase E2 component (dihydrolipoamide acetyltransferase)
MKENRVEYFGISRKIISNMTCESWETIPHVCLTYEPEVTEALNILNKINEDRNDATKFTINTAILKIIVEGLKSCPKMNGHIRFNRKLLRGEIKIMENIDISMPIVLDSGEMMTINMHDMENKTMSQMRDAIADSMRRASNSNMTEVMIEVSKDYTIQGLKKGKITQAVNRFIGLKFGKSKVHTLSKCEKKKYDSIPQTDRLIKYDLEVGTITVSNMGSIYKDWRGSCTLLEIIPPQLVAIAVGAIQDKAVVGQDGTIRFAKVLPFTIAFDHRALDMGDIVPFMKKLDQIFKEPQILYEYI